MIMMNKTENLWYNLEKENSFSTGIVMKRYSSDIIPDVFIALLMPEKIKSIAFRLDKEIDIDFIKINLKDIRVQVIQDESMSDKHLLVFSLSDFDLVDIFSVLCEDLIQSVSRIADNTELFNTLLDRFQQWQELFKKNKNKPLSIGAQIGLFGELYFLRETISIITDPLLCVTLWKGPESGIRDFEHNLWAVEVKTTSTHNQQKLYVNSERQLDSSHLNDLFLLHLSIELRDNSRFTLNSIIDDIRKLISESTSALSRFNLKLIEAGYLSRDFNFYKNQGYEIRSVNYYRVFDKFPRIEERDLRVNVGDVKYSIIPPENEKFRISIEKLLELLDEN